MSQGIEMIFMRGLDYILPLKTVQISAMFAEIFERQIVEHQRTANKDESWLFCNFIHKFLRNASLGTGPVVICVRQHVLDIKSLIRFLELVESFPVPDVSLSFVEEIETNSVTKGRGSLKFWRVLEKTLDLHFKRAALEKMIQQRHHWRHSRTSWELLQLISFT